MLACTCTVHLAIPPARAYHAWTKGLTLWLADADGLAVTVREGAPFHFRVSAPRDDGGVSHHPHYGRFLELVPGARMRCTWVTGPGGTDGAETILTLTFTPQSDGGTHCTLRHEGFASGDARDRHARAWPVVLAAQAARLATVRDDEWDAHVGPLPATHPLPFNRSGPAATFVPTRSYPDLHAAVAWLVDVLGCREQLRAAGQRVQLTLGEGAVVVAAWDPASAPATGGRPPATLVVRVDDVEAAWQRALAHGATGLAAPVTRPDGERQATVRDPAGHAWTLSQTVADVDPAAWGAEWLDRR